MFVQKYPKACVFIYLVPVNRQELSPALYQAHEEFAGVLANMPAEQFLFSPEEKWTPGQHGEHLHISAKILNKALKMPLFLIKWKFGKANRPSRTYDELVKRYQERLAKSTKKAPSRFAPELIPFDQKEQLCNNLQKLGRYLQKHYKGLSDKQLDQVILPHPLLGYLTLREMGFFMIHHVQHHQEIVNRYHQYNR